MRSAGKHRNSIKKFAGFFVPAMLLAACTYHPNDYKKDEYLDKEIATRLSLLAKDTAKATAVLADSIDRTVSALLLLAADVENRNACVNRSNTYFKETARSCNVNAADLVTLNGDVPLRENVRSIKANELILLNGIILKGNTGMMITAQ